MLNWGAIEGKLLFVERMFHLARHKGIGVLLKEAQAGAGAKVDLLTPMVNTRIFCRVFEFASAGGFVFGRLGVGGSGQKSVFLVTCIVIDVPCTK